VRKRRRRELTDVEKKARRDAAEAKRQAKLDAFRTVTHTVVVPAQFADGRTMPSVTSTVYEWRPGELVRVVVTPEQRAMPEGFIRSNRLLVWGGIPILDSARTYFAEDRMDRHLPGAFSTDRIMPGLSSDPSYEKPTSRVELCLSNMRLNPRSSARVV
jgi:hypothetical protein